MISRGLVLILKL